MYLLDKCGEKLPPISLSVAADSAQDDNDACGYMAPQVEIVSKDSGAPAYLSQRGPAYPTGHSSQINPRLRSKWHVGLKLC